MEIVIDDKVSVLRASLLQSQQAEAPAVRIKLSVFSYSI